MATNIARLNVQIVGDGKALRVDLKQNDAALRKFGKTATTAGTTLTNAFSVALGNIGSAVFLRGIRVATQALSSLIRTGLEFNETFQQSIAIQTSLTDIQEDALRAAAVSTSFNVKATSEQIAEGFFFLASAGQDAEQQLQSIGFAAEFAQAGMFNLGTAVDLLTDAQSALGLTSKDAVKNLEGLTRVGDTLVEANTLANASVEQFAESLTTKAGAAMRALNIDIEEGVAILAAYADQGVKGALAGTQLSIVLRDLTTKAIKNAAAFERVGISVFDQEGDFRRFTDILGDVENALDGLSDRAQKELLLDIGFSDKSLASLQTLLGTSDKIDEYEQKMRTLIGTTQNIANRQFTEFSKATNLVSAAWGELAVQITNSTSTVVPAIEDVGTVLQNFTSELKNFDEQVSANRKDNLSGRFRTPIAAGQALLRFFGVLESNLGALTKAEERDLRILKEQSESRRVLARGIDITDERKLQLGLPLGVDLFAKKIDEVTETVGQKLAREFGEGLEAFVFPDEINRMLAIAGLGERPQDDVAKDIGREVARQTSVEAITQGSIGELASRLAGLDAARAQDKIGAGEQQQIDLLAAQNDKLDDIFGAIEDDGDDINLDIRVATLP